MSTSGIPFWLQKLKTRGWSCVPCTARKFTFPPPLQLSAHVQDWSRNCKSRESKSATLRKCETLRREAIPAFKVQPFSSTSGVGGVLSCRIASKPKTSHAELSYRSTSCELNELTSLSISYRCEYLVLFRAGKAQPTARTSLKAGQTGKTSIAKL